MAGDPSLTELFTRLGYEWGLDGMRGGVTWYEVCKGGVMFVQIDTGIPVATLVVDFRHWLRGEESPTTNSHTVSGEQSPELDEFMRAVVAAYG